MVNRLCQSRHNRTIGLYNCEGCVAKTGVTGGRVRDRVWKAPIRMPKSNPFKWRHYKSEIILLCVRWYLSYPLSYRQVAEMVNERGLDVYYVTVFRWVQEYGTELDRRCRPHLRPTNDFWRVDETYIEVKGKPKYLYRAVDSNGNTLDFLLTAKRDAAAAKRFLRNICSQAVFATQPLKLLSPASNSISPSWKDFKVARLSIAII